MSHSDRIIFLVKSFQMISTVTNKIPSLHACTLIILKQCLFLFMALESFIFSYFSFSFSLSLCRNGQQETMWFYFLLSLFSKRSVMLCRLFHSVGVNVCVRVSVLACLALFCVCLVFGLAVEKSNWNDNKGFFLIMWPPAEVLWEAGLSSPLFIKGAIK